MVALVALQRELFVAAAALTLFVSLALTHVLTMHLH